MTDEGLVKNMAAAMFKRAYMLDISSAKSSLPYAAERFETYARAAISALREAGYEIRPRDGKGFADGIEAAAAYLESQSAKSSVPELTAYRTWAHEVRKLAHKIPEREDDAIPE